jgi:hypothetical protein
MITLIPAENESPAFCILKGKLLVPVTYYLFQNVLRKLIKEIGEDPKQYSSHSSQKAGLSFSAGINVIILMYAFTGQSEEFGISTKGIYNVLSPHCIVFDQQISKINILFKSC